MGEAQVHEVCLTPEQAKSPKEDFFAGADKNCRYEHFKWGDGKIDLKLNCKHPNATQTMVMVGEYEPDSYTMTMTATNVGGGPAGQMAMKMKVDAKRIGDLRCRKEGPGRQLRPGQQGEETNGDVEAGMCRQAWRSRWRPAAASKKEEPVAAAAGHAGRGPL